MSLKRVISSLKMDSNELNRRYLTLQEAVDDELESTRNKKEDIVTLPLAQGHLFATDVEKDDKDICKGNNLLLNNKKSVHKEEKATAVARKNETTLKEIRTAKATLLTDSHLHLA